MENQNSVRELLQKINSSKSMIQLTLEEQAIMKAAVIRRDESMTEFVQKIIKEEAGGRMIELIELKAMVDDYSGKNDDGKLRDLREAAAKREEEQYLENLMSEMEQK